MPSFTTEYDNPNSLAKISREDDQVKVQVTVTAGEDAYAKLSLICQIAA